jgi:glycosyltransferase involved in cell wall biosynthesis
MPITDMAVTEVRSNAPEAALAQTAHRVAMNIATDFGGESLIAATLRAILLRRPLLLRITRLPRRMGILRRLILTQADVIVVDSTELADAVRGMGVSESQIVRLSKPEDLNLSRTPPRFREVTGTCKIVHVGDLEPEGGVAELLTCLAAWAGQHEDKAVQILWAGEGCMQGVLEAQPIPTNLTQHFLGNGPRSDLASLFSSCDILAVPALSETWGRIITEAMVCGLPILGSNRLFAVREFVTDGETGWVFDPFERGAMIRAVDRALSTPPSVLAHMGVNVHRRSRPAGSTELDEIVRVAMRIGQHKIANDFTFLRHAR